MQRLRSSQASKNRSARSSSRSLESLEARRLLAVAVNSGVLTLTGGTGNDAYVVGLSGSNVTVTENGGTARSFTLSSLNSISASLGGGNDTINVANALRLPASVSGGAGNDAIITGGGNDTLDGGTGDDYLDGRGGTDTVTYAARTENMKAELYADLRYEAAPVFSLGGGGGAVGESDVYASVETLSGGSGNDTLSLRSDTWDSGEFELPSLPPMRINGNGGSDQLNTRGTSDGSNTQLGAPVWVADGGEGNDRFFTLFVRANSTIIGGGGDDFFYGAEDGGTVIAGTGFDSMEFQSDSESRGTYTMPAGLEKIEPYFLKSVIGNDEANTIIIADGFGIESIDGRGGNDFIQGSFASAAGGAGNDFIQGSFGSAAGGAGDDTIIGSEGDNVIDPGTGDDSIDGGGGQDRVTYASRTTPVSGALGIEFTPQWVNPPSFTLTGRAGAAGENDSMRDVEELEGGSANDSLFAGAGPTDHREEYELPLLRLIGNRGDDELRVNGATDGGFYPNGIFRIAADGGEGNDFFPFTTTVSGSTSLIGGAGNDTFDQFLHDDTASIDAGAGFDSLSYDNLGRTSYTMPAGLEKLNIASGGTVTGNELDNVIEGAADYVDGLGGNDRISIRARSVLGGQGNDTLIGTDSGDSLDGGAGNDSLIGAGGDDTLHGGDGVDTIDGGARNDTILTGAGDDSVVPSSGTDTIDGVATTEPIRINFQPANAATPTNYRADTGLEFERRPSGDFYGWNADNTAGTRERNANSDQRLDTLIHLRQNGDYEWQYSIGDGVYDVTIAAGDPSYTDQVNDFLVNGVLVRDADGAGNFDTVTIRVTLTNFEGLRIRSAASGVNPKLNYVIIDKAPTTQHPAPSELTALAQGQAVKLTWKNNSPAADYFNIERRLAGSSTWTSVGTVLSDQVTFTDTTVSPGNTYEYAVWAAAPRQVPSAFSNIATVTVPAAADSYQSAAIGNPVTPGSTSVLTPGSAYDITAGGADVWGKSDQFRYVYKNVTGNFDYSVRVEGLTQADIGSMAGLMARESLAANSRHIFMRTRPEGMRANYRLNTGGDTVGVGNTPFSYPNAWVRLQRVGNTFTAYASTNGANWSVVTQQTIAMPTTIAFGMAVSARTSSGATATARFRQLLDRSANQPVPAAPSDLTVGQDGPSGRVFLSWNDNANTESGFRVERRTAGSSTWSVVGTYGVNAGGIADLNTTPGTTYVYRVFAFNAAGDSAPSNEATLTTASTLSFTNTGIGTSDGSAQVVTAGKDFNVTTRGADVWFASDELRFLHRELTGNFDMKVRVANITQADLQSMGGLMARSSLAANASNVFVKTRPDGKNRMTYRSSDGAQSVGAGGGTSAFPSAWLRLTRVGNAFTGYASTDGVNWTIVATVSLLMPNTMYVGMAASAHTNTATTTVQFRDLTLA